MTFPPEVTVWSIIRSQISTSTKMIRHMGPASMLSQAKSRTAAIWRRVAITARYISIRITIGWLSRRCSRNNIRSSHPFRLSLHDLVREISKRRRKAPFLFQHLRDVILRREYAGPVEHRPVHAHPLHGGSLRRAYLHRASDATAHGAGHEFLQRHLARDLELLGQDRGSLQHRRRTAGEDL